MPKDFDAVAWMRKRRAEIDEEDRGLSWEEKARKTRRLLRRSTVCAPGARVKGRRFPISGTSLAREGSAPRHATSMGTLPSSPHRKAVHNPTNSLRRPDATDLS